MYVPKALEDFVRTLNSNGKEDNGDDLKSITVIDFNDARNLILNSTIIFKVIVDSSQVQVQIMKSFWIIIRTF